MSGVESLTGSPWCLAVGCCLATSCWRQREASRSSKPLRIAGNVCVVYVFGVVGVSLTLTGVLATWIREAALRSSRLSSGGPLSSLVPGGPAM